MMLGRMIPADEALRCGLVDVVAEPGEILTIALADARRFAAGPPRALALLRRHFADPPANLRDALEREIAIQAELIDTDDFAEGIAAFAQRRRPEFPGS